MVLTLSHVPVVDAGLVEHLERVHQKFYYSQRYHKRRDADAVTLAVQTFIHVPLKSRRSIH